MKISLPRRGVFLLGLAVLSAWAGTAAAQIGPYPYYYGGWGGYPYDTSATYNTTLTNASQQHMPGRPRRPPSARPCRAAFAARFPTRRRPGPRQA